MAFSPAQLYHSFSVDRRANGTMTNLTVEIPKLPKLDKDDLKAIRSFLPGKLLGRAAALLSLLLLVLGFVAAVRVGVRQIPEFEHILPSWAFWVLLALCFLAVVAQIVLEWRANRNRVALQELAIKPGAVQTGYFRIGAYADTDEDRKQFTRPDQAETKVLEWLKRATAQVPLYLTGDSGSGKSSLLNAFVLPTLREQGWTVIEARTWQDPVDALGKALGKAPSTGRSKANSDRDPRGLVEGAARRSERMLIVLDQFEEFLILGKPQNHQAFAAFVADLQRRPIKNFALLLVLRSDYQFLLEDAGLPPMRSGENLFQLARFQLSAAEAFMKLSGLDLQPAPLSRLLTSAAELDDTPGLVRPITINVIGFVLASGRTVASSLDAGALVRQYIEQTLQQPAIRDHAARLLEQMITEQGTKRPRSEQSLATDAVLRPAEVRAVLNCLSDAGLARPLNPARGEWELSHDFIARAVARFLGRHRTQLLRRVGAYTAPALLIVALLGGAGAVVWNRLSPDTTRAQLSDMGIATTSNEAGEIRAETQDLNDDLLSRAAPLLTKLGDRLKVLSLARTKVTNVDALKGLTALQGLFLSGTPVTSVDALKGLTALHYLGLSGTLVTSVDALKGTGLRDLNLARTSVTNVDALKGLTALQDLDLARTQVTNVDALKGLTALQRLDLSETPVTSVDALKGLTALERLDLSGTPVTSVDALKGLTALKILGLSATPVTSVDALKGLTALHYLGLSGTLVTSVDALKGLTYLQITGKPRKQ
jgi:Leucine-rich repeat (LRR) protein